MSLRQEMRRLREQLAKKQKKIVGEEIKKWQRLVGKGGPIKFAKGILLCPTDVPPHPDFDPDNNPKVKCDGWYVDDNGEEVCYCPFKGLHERFRNNGVPYHIIPSENQIEFLNDLWTKPHVKLILLAAARGAGKTFCLGIWNCFQISTQDNYSITCMGGSSEQSELIQEYIDFWRLEVPMLSTIINRSLHGIKKSCRTIGLSKCKFPACSSLSSKGPHVNEVDIDEACAAEAKSEDGAKAVKSAPWQLTGKRVGKLIMTSTADYIFGTFYEFLKDPKKYGFKTYQWSIAKHISGKKPMDTYTDKDPSHWKPSVWWMTNEEIRDKRTTKSDEEWLSMALGGASMASGAVFKKKDLDIAICSICEECEPYNWDKCKLCEMLKLGTPEDPIKQIGERRGGWDYGDVAPCALTIVGRKKDTVFVLYNHEQMGLREKEKISWIHDTCQEYKTWTFIPDPATGGKHLNEPIEDKGYAVYLIAEAEKIERVHNVINFVEKHKVVVPKKFWYLTQSLRKLAWDKSGKIRKKEDHSFDTLCYAMVDFRVEEGGNILDEFLKQAKKKKKTSIDDAWGVKFDW